MANKTSSARPQLIIIMAFLFLMFPITFQPQGMATASAQEATPSPTPVSPEEQRLEEEKKILALNKENAELRKAIAEANKAELEARFPKPTTTPLAGTTTVSDGAVIESQMVAYISMAKAANAIIDGITKHNGTLKIRNLAIYNERDVNLLLSYRVANDQIKIMKQSYCGLLAPSETKDPLDATGKTNLCAVTTTTGSQNEALPIFSVAQSFLGAFIDMTALLRTNVEIKGQSFDIDEAPLVAEVFRAARRTDATLAGTNLYYPFVIPPNVNLNQSSEILRLLQTLHSLRTRAGKLLADLTKQNEEIEKSKAKIKELKGSIKALQNDQAAAEAAVLRLLQAYCVSLSAGDMDTLDKINLAVRRACPGMPGEKRERQLELRDNIIEIRSKLAKANADLETEKTNADELTRQLAILQMKINPAFNTNAGISLDDAIAQLKAINEQFDKFVNALVAVDAGTGFNPLTNYIRAENLLSALPQDGGSYWLQLKVLKAGGNNRIKTNLLIDIFTGGNRVSHSGGVIIQYNLFDLNGKSVVSDAITNYTNYIKANKIKNLPSSEVDDRP